MAEIILCCGKISCGKSTFAKRLETERGVFPFSADEWMLHFYGEPPEREVFEASLGRCKEMIYRLSERLLARDQDVVLDFGFWQREERERVRARFEALGHEVALVYFPIEEAKQMRFLQTRQASGAGEHYVFDAAGVAVLNAMFECPAAEESFLFPEAYLGPAGQ